jgi:putative peptidoglycan lipid II flippase
MSVGRTALWLVPLALVARGAGFVVPLVIAGWYGVRPETDAFYFALSVPSFLLVLASNAMGTVAVPHLAALRHDRADTLPAVVAGAATAAAAAAAVVGAGFALALPFVLPRVASFDTATAALAVRHTWLLLPFVGLVAALAVIRAACEVSGSFRLASLAPVARASANLATVGLAFDLGPDALPVGMVVGAFAELAWLTAVLRRAGVPLAAPRWPRELGSAALAVGSVLVGEAMVALNLVVDKAFATALPSGSVTLLEYADRARVIPQSLLESSLLVVAFNTWAAARARGDREAQRTGVAQALRWVFLLAPPMLAGMVVGREVIVSLLFGHGAFPAEGIRPCADALGASVPGIFASLVGALLVKAHIVEGRYRLVLALGAGSMATNALLNVLLAPHLQLVGLALSTSLTTGLVSGISWRLLRRPGEAPPALARDGLAVLVASALAAGVLVPMRVTALDDPRLWLAALPMVALLAAGALRARRAR